MENEIQTLYDLENGKNTHTHTHTHTHTNVKKENCPLQDMEFGKKIDKRGKGETHIVGREIWQETL